jgi:hypothetical protein
VARLLVIAMTTALAVLASACSTTVGGTPKVELPRTTASAPPPAAPAAARVDETALDGLLLTVDDVRAITAAPDLQVDQTYEQMPPSTVGYVPEDCVRAAYNTVEAGYRDTRFSAVRGVVMQEPADAQLLHVVDQGLVTFPDADAATVYVSRTLEAWRRCAGTPFTALRPEASEHWTFGQVSENGGVNAISKTADESDWSCSHAITARANVVVDVSACGFSVADQATTIATRIRDKIPA